MEPSGQTRPSAFRKLLIHLLKRNSPTNYCCSPWRLSLAHWANYWNHRPKVWVVFFFSIAVKWQIQNNLWLQELSKLSGTFQASYRFLLDGRHMQLLFQQEILQVRERPRRWAAFSRLGCWAGMSLKYIYSHTGQCLLTVSSNAVISSSLPHHACGSDISFHPAEGNSITNDMKGLVTFLC